MTLPATKTPYDYIIIGFWIRLEAQMTNIYIENIINLIINSTTTRDATNYIGQASSSVSSGWCQ